VIEFVEETATIADAINLEFTATITDGDGDAMSDSFSVDLGVDDDPLTAPDITLTGIAAQDDAFNIDVGSSHADWVVNDFDVGDRIVLLNADAPHVLNADPLSGADAEISVNGTQVVINYAGGFAGEVTEADILVAYGDLVIDGAVSFGGDATGVADSDAFVSDGGGDTLTGGDGADAFVYFEPPAAGDTITDFDGAEGDRFVISASGFDVALDEGALSSDKFVFGDGAVAADSDDYFLYDTVDGRLYFDADGSGSDAAPVLVATLDGIPALEADDIVVIA
jgi:Ca2+-binding RTX toxin-like protein